MPKTVAVVQARTSSTRLPNKVLKNLKGKPVIEQLFHQLSFCSNLDEVVLATSDDPSDTPLETWAAERGIHLYRGDLDDVLDRYYQAAKEFGAETVVRITGDCPLIDPDIVDEVIALYNSGTYDYVSNVDPPTFPDGLDTEVFSIEALGRAWEDATLKSDREHVTTYIRNNKELFRTANYANESDLSHYRITLDKPEDYEVISHIYHKLYKSEEPISMRDVLLLLENDDMLASLNKDIKRNEGYDKSLREDEG